MAFSHIVGGTTFTEANFEGNAYATEATGFAKAMEKMVEHVANAYRGTSTTSTAVGTGSKTLTITNANSQIPAFAVGMPVRLARTSAPTATYMQGEITAFAASTGVTTINVDASVGSGTHTDWTITVGGNLTTATASPLGVAAGGTGATSAAAAFTALAGSQSTFADGSASAPSITSSTASADSGLAFLAADTVSVVSGGTEQFRFGSNPIPGASKNLIHNGAMTVNQRGSTASNTNNLDRFKSTWYDLSSVAVATVTKDADSPAGFGSSMKFDVTTQDTSFAGAYYLVYQNIEGQNVQHLNYGTAGALTTTFSFWFKTTVTGVYSAWLATRPTGLTYIREFTVESSNTWEFFQVTFPGYTGAVIVDSTAAGLQLGITFASSVLTGAVGEWQAGNDVGGSTNQVNGVSSTSNNILTTGWMLEVGEIATDFPHESYDTVLARCQRYFWRRTRSGGTNHFLGMVYLKTTSVADGVVSFPQTMRAAATIAFSAVDDFAVNHNNSAVTTSNMTATTPGTDNVLISCTASGFTVGQAGYFYMHTNGDYIQASAEL